jgi:hypothetical protein
VNYTVTEKSKKTIAWLKQNEIYESLIKSAEEQRRSFEQKQKDTGY